MNFEGKRWMKRLTGVLLALALVVSFGLYRSSDRQLRAASEEETEIDAKAPEETLAKETEKLVIPKETKAPETKAPETKAPETKAPETKAPETEAPETKAPETKAPETEAPETKAPETEAPETVVPETEVTETKTPERKEEPETEAPSRAASTEEEPGEEPAESAAAQEREEEAEPAAAAAEPEPEGEPAQVLRAEAADGAIIILTAPEGALPAGASVKVTLVTDLDAQEAVESALDEDTEVVELTAYDIAIRDENGEEIQPALPVEIRIQTDDTGENEGLTVYRVDPDGNVERLEEGSDPEEVAFTAEAF